MEILEVLNQWFSFSKYNPEQVRFNLLNEEYNLHRVNKKIEILLEEYDSTGSLAVMYAKSAFEKAINSNCISMFDVVSNHESWHEYQVAWNAFHSDEVVALEDNYLNTINNIVEKFSNTQLIGKNNREGDKQVISSFIDRVVESISKLKLDVYKHGGPIIKIKKFSTSISIFNTLAQCIFSLENTEDGMYLCYIRMDDTADGYFGYFIKNNGNVMSLNERPNEAYPGQHSGNRNGRWTEDKAYDIFPYDAIFSFANHDYKGYSSIHKIDDSNLNIFSLGANVYLPIVLTMLMLSQKYTGKTINESITYIDSLLIGNVKQLINCVTDKSLIPVETSAIAKINMDFAITFTQEDVISGTGGKRFNYEDNKEKPYYEKGSFPEQSKESYVQLLIDLYGDDFELDKSELLVSDSCMGMLPTHCDDLDGKKSNCGNSPGGEGRLSPCNNVEFVGTKARMEMEAYRQARKQLADHINQKMFEEYKAFGGSDAVLVWLRNEFESNREQILRNFIKLYVENKVQEMPAPNKFTKWNKPIGQEWSNNDCVKLENNDGLNLHCYPNTKSRTIYKNWDTIELSKQGTVCLQRGRVVRANFDECEITGSKCSIYFTFKPNDWKDIEHFIGKEVPKLLKGWQFDSHEFGLCNKLLTATDAVTEIKTPLEILKCNGAKKYEDLNLNKQRITLGLSIGFSKSGLKKLVKEYCETN